MIETIFAYSLLIVAILLIVWMINDSKRDGFRADPDKVIKTEPLLKSPNTFKKFKDVVCGTDVCEIDAVDYMDSRKMVREGTFTKSNVENMLQ